MNTLYIDAFSGVSGDKMVGALLSILDEKEFLLNNLSSLSIKDNFAIEIVEKDVMGINSIKFNVIVRKEENQNRNFFDITEIINKSSVSINAKKIAIDIFDILAKAESKVHNIGLDKIHFHEVGAIDSIIDILSVGILIDKLEFDEIYCSPVALGNGFIKTMHGVLPVPAPATAELLKGIPVYKTDIQTELTTPTGAAIIKHLVNKFFDLTAINYEKIGYGAGTKDLDIPNVLRLYLGKTSIHKKATKDYVVMLQANIDDSTPEQLGYLMDKLFEKGVLEAFYTPVLMKKNRLAQLLTVLCKEQEREFIETVIFKNSSTFGIRRSYNERTILEREEKIVNIDGIDIKIKIGKFEGKAIQTTIEYESVKEMIKKLNVSYNECLNIINKFLFTKGVF